MHWDDILYGCLDVLLLVLIVGEWHYQHKEEIVVQGNVIEHRYVAAHWVGIIGKGGHHVPTMYYLWIRNCPHPLYPTDCNNEKVTVTRQLWDEVPDESYVELVVTEWK